MLTQEQIAKMDEITGLTGAGIQANKIAQLREIRNAKKQAIADEPKGFEKVIGKIADFTGGKELGQGIATAIMQPKLQKDLEEQLSTKSEIQGSIIQRIKENREAGKDNTRLVEALKDITQQIADLGQGAEKTLNPYDLTAKQVLGDALQLGTTIVGAGTLPGVAKTATTATTIGKGIVQGAKSGAIAGTGFGASQGVSNALQEDKSLKDVAISGVKGAVTGATTGAVLGGVVGGVSGGLKGRSLRQAQKKEAFGLDLVSEKATDKVKQQALKEGRVTERGLLSGGKITPSKKDARLYEAVKDVIDPTKSAPENLNKLTNHVDELNSGLKAYVAENKVPFNKAQLRKQLMDGQEELKLVFASDSNAKKTYNAVVSEFMKQVKNKDTAGLFEARQSFDKIPAVKKLLDSSGLGENLRKEVVLTARGQANKYVAQLLPKGNAYRDVLLKESRILDAIGNIAEKNSGLIGVNKLQELTLKYPILKTIAGGVGAGLGLGAIGVGGSIIGSTD